MPHLRDTNNLRYAATPDAVKELLDGGGEFVPPPRLLNDLTEAQATAVPPGSPYSIAQILNHMHYFQGKVLAELRGESWPDVAHLDDTFASIEAGAWSGLRAAFLEGLDSARQLAEEKRDAVSPARDDTSVDYDLAENALHNAYHYGQIVLLRRMQGLWPPEGGEDYDF
jgi:hypothetical protein